MEHLSLTPATQAVLKALAELGQGNVHELADKSGKARSTTDKAIKTLADAGLIVAVDTDADPADGTPTRWTLSDDAAAALEAADLNNEPAGPDESDDPATDAAQTGDTEQTGDHDSAAPDTGRRDDDATGTEEGPGADQPDGDDSDDTGAPAECAQRTAVTTPARPGDRKVMTIKGVLADHSDGTTVDVIVAESGISHPTTIRLLAAMEQADAARRLPPETDKPERWVAGPTKASEVDPNPEPPRCALCFQVIRGVTSTPAAVAAVQSLIRSDGTLHVVGEDDQTHIVTLPTRLAPRSLNTSPSTVGQRSDATVNADGNQPFLRGELEKLTVAVLAANPGRPMTPQEIATAISAQLGGRNVSSGAVRNNCTKAAAAGSIQLVSEAPLTFLLPKPEDDTTDEQAPDGDQPGADTTDGADGEGNASAQPNPGQGTDHADQS